MRFYVVMHCGFANEKKVGPAWASEEDAMTAMHEGFTDAERHELNVDVILELDGECDD